MKPSLFKTPFYIFTLAYAKNQINGSEIRINVGFIVFNSIYISSNILSPSVSLLYLYLAKVYWLTNCSYYVIFISNFSRSIIWYKLEYNGLANDNSTVSNNILEIYDYFIYI